MPIFSSARHRTRVCACTPSTEETTSTAPSSTARLRSTSPRKSTWPGVSISWIRVSPQVSTAAAARTEMPRLRSTSIQSVWVVPSSTLPARRMLPLNSRSCSVTVVLPASAWARMPRFMVAMSFLNPSIPCFRPSGGKICLTIARSADLVKYARS